MRITDATLAIACRIPSDGTPAENTIHDLSLDLRDARARIVSLEAALREARAWVEEDTDSLEQCHQPYDPANAVDQDVRQEVEARRAWLRNTSENPR